MCAWRCGFNEVCGSRQFYRQGEIDGKSAIDVFTSLSHIGRDRFLNDLKVRTQNIVISQTHNPASPI